MQGHLFALAEELPEKLAVARNAAHLVEYEVKDLVRAFRAYLNAFRLAPDDEEIVGHLWRLATSIGRYHSDDCPDRRSGRADSRGSGRRRPKRPRARPTASSQGEAEVDAADGGSDDGGDESDGLDVVSEEVDVEVEVDGGEEPDAEPLGGETVVMPAHAYQATDATLDDSGAV